MTDIQDIADGLVEQDNIHQAVAIGEILVTVTDNKSTSETSIFQKALDEGYVLLLEEPKETGNVRVYGPVEWFD